MLFAISLCNAQSDSTFYWFDSSTSEKDILYKIDNLKQEKDISYLKLIYYSKLRDTDSMYKFINEIKSKSDVYKNKSEKVLYFEGYYHKLKNNDSLFLKLSNLAYKKAVNKNDSLTILHSLSALAQTYDYDNDYPYNLHYLTLLKDKAEEYDNNFFRTVYHFLLGNYYLFRDKADEASKTYKELLNYKFTKKDSAYILYTYNSLGVLYETTIQNSDSAIYYYRKKLNFMEKHPSYSSKKALFNTYINIGNAYQTKNELNNAELYYTKANQIDFKGSELFYKSIITENLSKFYEKTSNYKAAYNNLKEFNIYNDSLNKTEQRIAIADIKEKYDNEKLRVDNLKSEAKRKQNQNIAIGLAGSLALGSIIAFLLFKNTKRKQKLAEQEKELETQKLATVLKEQELTAIDAMIEGQEKERQRIANDLHDDLGGLMATVKLHFNALKDQQTPELYTKTNQLIDEAYDKVRTVAHAKNSGVIAKQGLLKAVKQMATNVSASNKITINVIDHGLDDRLENSLELTIFRIIQELITNVIKHANASEVNIHITNHEDSLNIMVEDNGKGFKVNQITKTKKGMGINSIDKRVAYLDGTMTIESEQNQGTTIIIDIPI